MTFNSEMAAALLSGFIGHHLGFSQNVILGAIVCTLIFIELIPIIHRKVVKS